MPKKLTQEEFIRRAKEIHGDKYNYYNVNYKNTATKVEIYCNECGHFFYPTPNDFLRGHGCPYCAGKIKHDTKWFIEKARDVHGNKYDYSKTKYTTTHNKVCIICPEHGEFWQVAKSHINGCGCRVCMGKYMNTEIFIQKAHKVHGDRYDYSLVKFERSNKKVKIICPIHGEFEQTPNSHLDGHGCNLCSIRLKAFERAKGKDDFIDDAIRIHGNRYDYSMVKYTCAHSKVEIVCPKHGSFFQTPNMHLNGSGCPKCYEEKRGDSLRLTTKEFIERANAVHNGKYNYEKVEYKNSCTPVKIICPIHGEFMQNPMSHLSGYGCKKCSGNFMDKDYFIELSNKIHKNKYDYSLVDYNGSHKAVYIICPIHGLFKQTPGSHLRGHGCPKCNPSNKMDTNDFIRKALIIHGDEYDYSLVNYINSKTPVKIKCKKHGVFLQKPNSHLMGHKCPYCNTSHGENKIRNYLLSNNVVFNEQYCISLDKRLFSRNNIKVDFYLKDFNAIIEFNGIQHYKYTPAFHKEIEDFEKQKERDKRLDIYCKNNRIKLVVIRYDQIDNIEEILNNELNTKQLCQKRKQN